MTTNAREIINTLLDLPRVCSGLDSRSLDAEIALVECVPFTIGEFGDLLEEARTARSTVISALLALRDAAFERERRGP